MVSSPPQTRRRDAALAALLAAATFAVYLPALGGGRLLDDDRHITAPALRSLRGLGRIWLEPGTTQQYYPVLHTAFWVEHRLWGGSVLGYHLVNVLLHVCAALLLVAVVRQLRLPGAWLAGFLFALHPVCVESVAWIAEQKNTLSTAFGLGAALAYFHFEEDRRPFRYWLAFGLFGLALLSKSAVAPLPAILVVLAWWRRPRLEWRRDVVPLLPWFCLVAAVGLATFFLEQRLVAEVGGVLPLGPAGRLIVAGRAFWFYLGKLIWPAELTFFYPRWQVDAGAGIQFLWPLAVAILAAALVAAAAKGRRAPLAVFLCFVCALAPVLGFFNTEWFVFSYVADHLQYLAAIAVLVPLAAAAMRARRLEPGVRQTVTAAACAAPALLGFLTWRQCIRYGDPLLFYRTAARLSPESAAAYDNLGAVLSAMPGRLNEAVAAYRRAIAIDPRIAQGHEDLGTALLQDPARRAEAVAELEAAVRLRPGKKSARDKLAYALSRTHNDLGLALAQAGRLPEAIDEFQEAIRLDPGFAGGHNNLGLAWSLVPGRLNDAIAEFRTGLRLNPDFAPGWHCLGVSLCRAGDFSGGAAAFREELRLSPDSSSARAALEAALQQVRSQ